MCFIFFLKFLSKMYCLTVSFIKEIIVEKKVVKGELILANNSLKKEHIFVASGCLRSFYTTENGKEHTIQFAIKNWWISDYITLYTDNAAMVSIESVTHSKILVIENAKIEELYAEFPQFEASQRKNFQKRLAALQKRILGLLTLTASEKYTVFDSEIFEL